MKLPERSENGLQASRIRVTVNHCGAARAAPATNNQLLIGRRFDATTYSMASVVELTALPPAPLPAPVAPATFDWLPRVDNAGAVPEPASWLMLITGFGLAGVALRRQRAATARSASASAWSFA